MSDKMRMNLNIERATHRGLKVFCAQTGRTMTEVIDEAVKVYVNRQRMEEMGRQKSAAPAGG